MLMISLLIVLVIFSVIIVYTFTVGSGSVSFGDAIHVTNEEELRNAVNDAENGKPVTIVFDKDISLTDSPLIIPANKNITLTSKSPSRFYKLNGVDWYTTIIVEDGGILRLNGIAVAHVIGDFGCGVQVATGGTLVMYSGEISGNTGSAAAITGGVRINNGGSFMMYGGTISGNTAMYGGGVYNNGVFEFFSGKISGNTAFSNGGGVYNELYCNFTMYGGAVSNNTAVAPGGGVYNRGTFTMSDGIISDNTASIGDGVYNRGSFNRLGGEILDNITNAG
jgi:hypothetical protein